MLAFHDGTERGQGTLSGNQCILPMVQQWKNNVCRFENWFRLHVFGPIQAAQAARTVGAKRLPSALGGRGFGVLYRLFSLTRAALSSTMIMVVMEGSDEKGLCLPAGPVPPQRHIPGRNTQSKI